MHCYTFMHNTPDEISIIVNKPIPKDNKHISILDLFNFAARVFNEQQWASLIIKTNETQPDSWQLQLEKYRLVIYLFQIASDEKIPKANEYLLNALIEENAFQKQMYREKIIAKFKNTYHNKNVNKILRDASVAKQVDNVVQAQIDIENHRKRLTSKIFKLKKNLPASKTDSKEAPIKSSLSYLANQHAAKYSEAVQIRERTQYERKVVETARNKEREESKILHAVMQFHKAAEQQQEIKHYLDRYKSIAAKDRHTFYKSRQLQQKLDPIQEIDEDNLPENELQLSRDDASITSCFFTCQK